MSIGVRAAVTRSTGHRPASPGNYGSSYSRPHSASAVRKRQIVAPIKIRTVWADSEQNAACSPASWTGAVWESAISSRSADTPHSSRKPRGEALAKPPQEEQPCEQYGVSPSPPDTPFESSRVLPSFGSQRPSTADGCVHATYHKRRPIVEGPLLRHTQGFKRLLSGSAWVEQHFRIDGPQGKLEYWSRAFPETGAPPKRVLQLADLLEVSQPNSMMSRQIKLVFKKSKTGTKVLDLCVPQGKDIDIWLSAMKQQLPAQVACA